MRYHAGFSAKQVPLKKDFYLRPRNGENIQERLGSTKRSILNAIKLQHSLGESPEYRWQTFRDWHVSDLNMQASALDPYLF